MPNLIKSTLSIRDTHDVILSNGPMFESILNEYVPYFRQFDYTMTHGIVDSTSVQDFIKWPMGVVLYENENCKWWVESVELLFPRDKHSYKRCLQSLFSRDKRTEHKYCFWSKLFHFSTELLLHQLGAIWNDEMLKEWIIQNTDLKYHDHRFYDPDDDNSPREIVAIFEHSVCDGLSLSNVAHELLIALAGENDNMFTNSLDWPIPMEMAIKRRLSLVAKLVIFGRAMFAAINLGAFNTRSTARIPIANVDFPLADMCNYCHTESCCGILSKDETQKLVDKCHREGVTVTAAVSSAIICTISTVVKSEENYPSTLRMSVSADVRRRCVPPVSNNDLSYQISCIIPIPIPTVNISTTPSSMWQLAKVFGHYVNMSVDTGQVLALGMILGKIFQKILGQQNFAELPTCGISSWGVIAIF
ncbi:unnamed protein product [Rotaria socialis]|uniref:Phthiocerol/phthiodiolone dimycocerosyl transferase C-terminal domain-containing protein n=1 Tax=Rotaria socialis TaxID=392032 RepID=A0A817ZV98_9BILA|nr:unnamed protein product [Rotaria socialis]CAF3395927.1 unnamed protein product [Rotaria socialis]CAF3644341.1 unnamed protein product [Rotaria socialis]